MIRCGLGSNKTGKSSRPSVGSVGRDAGLSADGTVKTAAES
jgi:hypothetical protein